MGLGVLLALALWSVPGLEAARSSLALSAREVHVGYEVPRRRLNIHGQARIAEDPKLKATLFLPFDGLEEVMVADAGVDQVRRFTRPYLQTVRRSEHDAFGLQDVPGTKISRIAPLLENNIQAQLKFSGVNESAANERVHPQRLGGADVLPNGLEANARKYLVRRMLGGFTRGDIQVGRVCSTENLAGLQERFGGRCGQFDAFFGVSLSPLSYTSSNTGRPSGPPRESHDGGIENELPQVEANLVAGNSVGFIGNAVGRAIHSEGFNLVSARALCAIGAGLCGWFACFYGAGRRWRALPLALGFLGLAYAGWSLG